MIQPFKTQELTITVVNSKAYPEKEITLIGVNKNGMPVTLKSSSPLYCVYAEDQKGTRHTLYIDEYGHYRYYNSNSGESDDIELRYAAHDTIYNKCNPDLFGNFPIKKITVFKPSIDTEKEMVEIMCCDMFIYVFNKTYAKFTCCTNNNKKRVAYFHVVITDELTPNLIPVDELNMMALLKNPHSLIDADKDFFKGVRLMAASII